jgi:hypothetical protein
MTCQHERWIMDTAIAEGVGCPICLAAENKLLRGALIQAGRNAGAILSDSVSTEFLMRVPEEVKLNAERLFNLVK